MKLRFIKKIIRKIYHLIWFLSVFLIFCNNTNALTQCNTQGNDSSLEDMPLIVFVGSGASSGKEYRFFTMDRAYGSNNSLISGSWNYQSFQKLCATTTGSYDNTSNYITFRISNYTYLVGNIYTITFSMTDKADFVGISANSGAAQNLDMIKILSASADPRDLTYYLTISFYVTSNYSGTSNFVFYSSNNLRNAFESSDWVYTPYITSTPRLIDNSSSIGSIKTDTTNIINGLSDVQTNITNAQSSIINNQNQTTQQIIDNQDNNTQQEIQSQKVCNFIDKSNIILDNKYLTSTGAIADASGVGITDYLNVVSSDINVLDTVSGAAHSCFYNSNKQLISCTNLNGVSGSLTIPSNSKFFRATISKSQNRPTFNICTNGNQALNNNLTDDSSPSIDLDINYASDTPISDLLTMPLTILNALLTNLSDTCVNYNLPFLFDSTVTFPCFTISDYLGNNLTHYIDLFICLYMCYNIALLCINVFEDITSLRDTFDSLYEPKHAYTGYKPKHAKGGGD